MQDKVFNYILNKRLPPKQDNKLMIILNDIGCNTTRSIDGYIIATCFTAFQCGFVSTLFNAITNENRLYLIA